MSLLKRFHVEILCIGLGAAILGFIVFVVKQSLERKQRNIAYSMMHFSNRAEFPQHARVTKLSRAIGVTESKKTYIYLATYEEPLAEEVVLRSEYDLVTAPIIRDRLNSDLALATVRDGRISPIVPTEQMFQRVSVKEEIRKTHTMILRDEGNRVLHFLEREFEEDFTDGQNKSLNPTSDP